MDLSKKTIENLFFEQVKDLTLRQARSFDTQFSEL